MKKTTNRQNCLHMWTWLATQKKETFFEKYDYFDAFPERRLLYKAPTNSRCCGACEEVNRYDSRCNSCPVQWSDSEDTYEPCHNVTDSPYYIWEDFGTAENAQKVLDRIKETWVTDLQM